MRRSPSHPLSEGCPKTCLQDKGRFRTALDALERPENGFEVEARRVEAGVVVRKRSAAVSGGPERGPRTSGQLLPETCPCSDGTTLTAPARSGGANTTGPPATAGRPVLVQPGELALQPQPVVQLHDEP